MIAKLCVLALLACSVSIVRAETTFTVDALANCGAPTTNGPTLWIEAGTHHFRYEGGAISHWIGYEWHVMADAYMHSTGEVLRWYFAGGFPSQAAASAAGAGQIFSWEFSASGDVTFITYDHICHDNRGSYTLTLLDDQVVSAWEEPVSFDLLPAYPNPFNPVTQIRYQLEQTGYARLSVHNLAGQEIAVLHDGLRAGGVHEQAFDASSLASGIYFARLQTQGGQRTQKLLLSK
jgi:hypothetical protein